MTSDHDNRLDELDYDIIMQLQDDGRKSYTDIAKALDVSVGTVRNRIKKMVDDGALKFICRPNAHHVGFHTPANIKVSIRPAHLIEQAVAAISKFPEVFYLALVAGEFDLDIDAMCRDEEHLRALLVERLHNVPGVHATYTSIILRVCKLSVPDVSLVKPRTEEMQAMEG